MADRERRPHTPPVEGPRPQVVTVRATDAWKAWIRRYATHRRSGIPEVIEAALRALAESEGFEPPPRR